MFKNKILSLIIVAIGIFYFSVDSFAQTTEELIITTYYPAPYGIYNQLLTNRLAIGDVNGDGSLTVDDLPGADSVLGLGNRTGDPALADSLNGNIYYNTTDNEIRAYINGNWTSFSSLWERTAANPDDIHNLNTGNVGIGTDTTEFKLSLDNDGGIIAKGTFGSGASLTTTGPGPRLIWYPKEAAFRAGGIAPAVLPNDQWDDANIGSWSVAFGDRNMASGDSSAALGGVANTASGGRSVVSGGISNEASGLNSVISGGTQNIASAEGSMVGGGANNLASGIWSVASGGDNNRATNDFAAIYSGWSNQATAKFSIISGGQDNIASGLYSVVSGGFTNTASGNRSTVSGGSNNTAGIGATVCGGESNIASGINSIVSGGFTNTASATRSTVSGGSDNLAAGDYSWVGGRNMQLSASADRTFVWGYASAAFSMDNPDRFLIFPNYAFNVGRVGINTATPTQALDVNGNIRVSGSISGGCVCPSDMRFKTNIKRLNHTLQKIDKIQPVYFNWNNNFKQAGFSPTKKPQIGIIAQELEKEFPELVSTIDDEGHKGIDYGRFSAVLLQAVKELKAENDTLKQRLEKLENAL